MQQTSHAEQMVNRFRELVEDAGDTLTDNHYNELKLIIEALLFASEKEELNKPGIIRTIYDPTMGTGGMVNIGKKHVIDEVCEGNTNKPTILTYGQEINEQSYAIAKSEALIT